MLINPIVPCREVVGELEWPTQVNCHSVTHNTFGSNSKPVITASYFVFCNIDHSTCTLVHQHAPYMQQLAIHIHCTIDLQYLAHTDMYRLPYYMYTGSSDKTHFDLPYRSCDIQMVHFATGVTNHPHVCCLERLPTFQLIWRCWICPRLWCTLQLAIILYSSSALAL